LIKLSWKFKRRDRRGVELEEAKAGFPRVDWEQGSNKSIIEEPINHPAI
jgi:hypothetical protein